MSTYRLVVRSGDQELTQGTGWLVGPTLVVTAFHVVGTLPARDWLHEGVDSVEYVLMSSPPVKLTPLIFDAEADIALLQAAEPVLDPSVLDLEPALLRTGTPWHGRGFPGFERGKPFALSGSVVDFHIHDPSSEIQLLVEQGTQASWAGVSGTPICGEDGRVLGVITQVTDATTTGWGATAGAVQRLLQRWTSQAPAPGSSETKANHRGTWRKLSSEAIQRLRERGGRGVALLEPLGFDAHQVVDTIVDQLARPQERLIPVRLVLDRSSASETWMYRKLARDLRDGLARSPQVRDVAGCAHGLALARDEDEAWPADGTDAIHFVGMVEKLIRGPLEKRGCKLVLFVEGLARMPREHVVRWGHSMRRLLDYGLELCLRGGRELPTFITPTGNDDYQSAFQSLWRVSVNTWNQRDILQILESRLGDQAHAVAGTVEAVTGGHPALVRELVHLPAALLERGDADEMSEQLRGCMHMKWLWREVEGRAELRETLRDYASLRRTPLPRKQWNQVEQELHLLGILSEVQGGWAWTAPVMRLLGEGGVRE